MEIALRAALLDWLAADPDITSRCNLLAEERPVEASAPWIGIAASAGTDWSTKTSTGSEIRIALECHVRGDDRSSGADLVDRLDRRALSLPDQPRFTVASATFLRSRSEVRARNTRAHLREYRFRLLAPNPSSGD